MDKPKVRLTPKQLEVLRGLPGSSNPTYPPIRKLEDLKFAIPVKGAFNHPTYHITEAGKAYLAIEDKKIQDYSKRIDMARRHLNQINSSEEDK